jgi:hypothetical protein
VRRQPSGGIFGQNHPPQGDTGPCFGGGYGRRRDLPPRAPGFVRITEPKIMKVVAPSALGSGIDELPRIVDELAAVSISGGHGVLFHM